MTYAIAKGSKTNSEEFIRICKKIGSPLRPASRNIENLLNKNLIERAFAVEERVFDGNILREIVRNRIIG